MPERTEVPDDLVPWRQPFVSYHPPYWTVPCSFRYCDPEVNTSTLEIKFNQKDRGIDRRMVRRLNGVKTYYEVRNGLPLNPLGRTGIAGRGYLPRWGPTHLVKVILLRKCKRFCKAVMEDRDIATKYQWSHKTDNQTLFEMRRSLEKMDEATTSSPNHRITFRRSVHRPASRGTKRGIALVVSLLGLYAIGIGFFIAGIAVPAIGVIVGAVVLGLALSLMTYTGQRFYNHW
ncbi:ADP-ribose pyrophosphatase, mitochondrial [Trichuris trichiura]|uniref:ADP-ribose pyrophosphatase, mitochondrial n=1 Tax=Trichuris trichiura TaxID=36087 RepID=A0A077ZDD6_TRITR|nr:ADP-ribose pyrophosphatase, mitochondrial [Trichuris trichiura]